MHRHRPPRRTIYGVFEVPHHIIDERSVESIWTDEGEANDRARIRSIQVHGRVHVVSWELDTAGARRVLRGFERGEPMRRGTSLD